MADKTIGDLTAADTPLDGDELIEIEQDGNSRKVAVSEIKNNTDLSVINANLAQIEWRRIAGDSLSYQQMVNGIADEYEDETGIDASASSGQRYQTTYYDNMTGSEVGGDLATSSNAISGGDTGASAKENAFDNSISTTWLSSQSGSGVNGFAYIGQNFDDPSDIQGFSLTQTDGVEVTSVKLQYSDDGESWTTAATKTVAANTTKQTFEVSSSGAHAWWRLLANSTPTSFWGCSEVEFIPVLTVPAVMTLVSDGFDAVAQPDTAILIIDEKDVDTVTLGTDLTAYASRDDGTTWTEGDLEDAAAISGHRILTTSINLSAQPAGTDMRYKLVTSDDVELQIHAASIQWS